MTGSELNGADTLRAISEMSNLERCEVNDHLPAGQNGTTLHGLGQGTVRSKTEPKLLPLHEQFALSSKSPSGLVYITAGRVSTATAGCPVNTYWPPEQDQRNMTVHPLNYRVLVPIGYVPILGLPEGWAVLYGSVPAGHIRAVLEHRERAALIQALEAHCAQA